MSDLMNAIIAAKLMGNGGGGGLPTPAQWDIVMSPTEFSFSEVQPGFYVGNGSATGWELNVGDVLRLTWDGTPYEITLFDFNDKIVGGNASIVEQGADTGEPFFALFSDGSFEIITKETDATHTISFDQWYVLPDGTTMQVIDGEWTTVEDSTKPLLITLNEDDEIDITYGQWRNAVRNASNIVIYDEYRQEYYPVLYPNDSDPPFITGINVVWDSNSPQINAYALNIYTNSSEESDDEIISVDHVERSNQLVISIT